MMFPSLQFGWHTIFILFNVSAASWKIDEKVTQKISNLPDRSDWPRQCFL